jgi:phenylacetate-CoA ligase
MVISSEAARGRRGVYSSKARQSPYWNEYLETMPRERLDSLHLKRLQATIRFAYDNAPMYREIYDREKVRPEGIRTLVDYIERLPILDKPDLFEFQRRNPPYGDTIVRGSQEYISVFFQTSGTTGVPLLEPGYFMEILTDQWTYNWWANGIRPTDVFYLAFPYGTFMAFWAAHYDALFMGGQVISGGGADSKTRMKQIEQLKPTVLVATPSYALHLAEVGKEMGIDPRKTSIRFVSTAGEPGPAVPYIKKAIEEAWDATAIDLHGISDVWGSCSWQCPKHPDRLHFTEASAYPLVIDEAGEPVANGGVGELVITSYRPCIQPMIKYRTRDLVECHREGCDCGRTWIWLRGGVLARTDQMAIVKGTNVYPTAVQAVVGEVEGLSGNLEIHLSREGITDAVSVKVEPLESVAPSDYRRLKERVENALRETIRANIPVELVAPGGLPRYELKAKRVIDHRPKGS